MNLRLSIFFLKSLVFWDDLMDVIFGCSVVAVLLCFWDVIFIQDEVLYDVQFIITI